MPPRGRKKAVKKPPAPAVPTEEAPSRDCQDEDPLIRQLDQEVERKAAALKANLDIEIEHLITALQLLRSSFKEQMDTPASQFFSDTLPNLSIECREENGQVEIRWKEKDTMFQNHAQGRDLCTSLLSRMSMAYPDCSTSVPHFGGYEFSTKSVKTSFLDVESMQIRDFVLDDPSDNQMNVLQDTFRTPGMNSQRLSVGMTPKTVRLPKPGEMLLSVHGSPLGVYPEENLELEPINESDES